MEEGEEEEEEEPVVQCSIMSQTTHAHVACLPCLCPICYSIDDYSYVGLQSLIWVHQVSVIQSVSVEASRRCKKDKFSLS